MSSKKKLSEKDLKDEIYRKFKSEVENKIKKNFDEDEDDSPSIEPVTSRQYDEFRSSFLPPHLSIYEKLCNFSEQIFKLNPDPKKVPKMKEDLETCHLNCTPSGVMSFSIVGPILFIILFSIVGYIFPFLVDGTTEGSFFFVVFAFLSGLIMIYPLGKLPHFLATSWRMKASNQMVLAIFYTSTYMRQNSNFELAVDFAAEYLSPPLSLDLKKIIWDVETRKYDSIKESLEAYLEKWKDYNREFVESMHLIESSLYETSDSRRLDALDKALEVILDETENKMMHYAHNLKTPLDTLNMLGIVLPVLGLVILPLMVSFMPEVRWYHLAAVYNLALPIAVYYLGKKILSTRPSGYGHVDLTTKKKYNKYRKIDIKFGKSSIKLEPKYIVIILASILLFIGIMPLILHTIAPNFDLVVVGDGVGGYQFTLLENVDEETSIQHSLQGYQENNQGRQIGPFGLGATLLSLFIPLAVGVSIGLYYKWSSKNMIKIRKRTKKLEDEFASALFQLGNRLGDGLPPEMALSKVSNVMQGTTSGQFFRQVSVNIRKLGLSVKKAVFDKEKGAINDFPSNIVETSMKILVQSAKKGALVAGRAMVNLSNYIKRMHRVDERLRDLMTDVVSSMKSQIKFLTPIIAGVVIGITSMITTILGSLSKHMEKLSNLGGEGAAGAGGISAGGLLEMFSAGVPTFYFQVIVGLYVVQIVYILTVISNSIINGSDKFNEKHELGKNLVNSTLLYIFIGGVVILIFNLIAGSILGGLM